MWHRSYRASNPIRVEGMAAEWIVESERSQQRCGWRRITVSAYRKKIIVDVLVVKTPVRPNPSRVGVLVICKIDLPGGRLISQLAGPGSKLQIVFLYAESREFVNVNAGHGQAGNFLLQRDRPAVEPSYPAASEVSEQTAGGVTGSVCVSPRGAACHTSVET